MVSRGTRGRDRFNILRQARNGGQVDKGAQSFLSFESALRKAAGELLFIKPARSNGWKALASSSGGAKVSASQEVAKRGYKADSRETET